jgi:CheY-like chemotaxis protein
MEIVTLSISRLYLIPNLGAHFGTLCAIYEYYFTNQFAREGVMQKKILVADDDFDERFDVELILKTINCEVITVENGEEALSAILEQNENKPYDLLITDIKMPLMSGIELIDELRYKNCLLPVIVLSGSIGPKEKNKLALHEGLKFISKPVDGKNLLEMIAHYLGKKALVTEVIYRNLSPNNNSRN